MVTYLIIYIQKFLDSDWLRVMQFLGNTMQKSGNLVQKMGNSVQKREKTEHSDWLINKGTQREPIRLEQLTGQNNSET